MKKYILLIVCFIFSVDSYSKVTIHGKILDEENQELNFYHHETHEIVNDIVKEDGRKTFQEFRDLVSQFKF